MKDFFQKNFQDLKEKFLEQRNISIEKLQLQRKKYAEFFDEQISKAAKKIDLVKEAAKQKTQLKKFKVSIPQSIFPFRLRMLLSLPFIYGMIIPGVFLHICIEIYHQVCFRLYGIPCVNPKDYFIIDRHHLSYLNAFEKLNCMYCGYFNGLMGYSREIAGRTERFFCPIKHAKNSKNQHAQYDYFVEYLDGEEYRNKIDDIRCFSELREEK